MNKEGGEQFDENDDQVFEVSTIVVHLSKISLWNNTVVINTECEGICYRIYARREGIIKELLPGVYPVTNARAWGIYYYYKDRPTLLKEISIYFYEVTRTRTPPYCFECKIALVKADNFTTNIQSSNRNSTSVFSAGRYWRFYSQLILCAQTGFRSLRTSGLYNVT